MEEATGSLKRSVQYTSRVFARQILSLEPLVFPAYRADPQKFQNPQARDNVLKYAEKLQDRIPRVKIKERKEKKKSGEKGKGEEKGKKKTKKKTEKKKKEFYSFESGQNAKSSFDEDHSFSRVPAPMFPQRRYESGVLVGSNHKSESKKIYFVECNHYPKDLDRL